MNKSAIIFLLALITSGPGKILHKESISLEYGKKYDSNVILPDSVTGKAALMTEAEAAPSFLVQFNPATMMKLVLNLASLEQDAFPENNGKSVGASVNAKHLFSHLTMVGAGAEYTKNASDNRFYSFDLYDFSMNVGRYLGPKTSLELTADAMQKEYPDLYRNDLTDRSKRSYYYDYRQAELALLSKRIVSEKWSLALKVNAAYKDFYNDVHDSDYVGFLPVIDYIDINTGDTIYLPHTDSTVIPLYEANIKEEDYIARAELYATASPLERMTVVPKALLISTSSNDPYFNSTAISGEALCRYSFNQSWIRVFYSYFHEVYPDRATTPDGETEIAHSAGITYGLNLNSNFSIQCGYVYRKFDATVNIDDYVKKTVSVLLRYAR